MFSEVFGRVKAYFKIYLVPYKAMLCHVLVHFYS